MDAEKRFWKSPDLLSQLLPFLDLSSILNLANQLPLIPQLLQRRAIWRDLVGRTIDLINIDVKIDQVEEYDEEYEEDYQKVEQLVGILKMMENRKPFFKTCLMQFAKNLSCSMMGRYGKLMRFLRLRSRKCGHQSCS